MSDFLRKAHRGLTWKMAAACRIIALQILTLLLLFRLPLVRFRCGSCWRSCSCWLTLARVLNDRFCSCSQVKSQGNRIRTKMELEMRMKK